MGGPDILAMGADDVLNELVAKTSSSQCFSLPMFSSVHGNGGLSGLSGVGCLSTIFGSSSSSLSFLSLTLKACTAGRGQS